MLEGFKLSWIIPEKQIFRKFLDMQSIYGFEAAWSGGDCVDDFVLVIMRSNDLFQSNTGEYGSFDQLQTMDVATFIQFHNFTCDFIEICTAEKGFHTLLPPLKEKCFSDSE